MSDMAERLRDLADQRPKDRGHDAVDDALREAADEIERLQRELVSIHELIQERRDVYAAKEEKANPFKEESLNFWEMYRHTREAHDRLLERAAALRAKAEETSNA
ncbi:hypothetical protein E5S70_17460 [Ensifer adhaerens]|uniref:hypothetical protein n=1 Tax=Ensifer canadensis TaxID=555315 RepID=UPI001490457C|nr:hypothetical protein [Ensifer canadensis]NOV17841.1 hypothetical protein [Ensifer canadensis]